MLGALLDDLIAAAPGRMPGRPALIGVGGAQGSGKTTLCRAYAATRARIAQCSLDDVYLTLEQRRDLAIKAHPLLATRGPPGTHDLDLARQTFTALAEADPANETRLPRFDKAKDDRIPIADWPIFVGAPRAIVFDGWCLGATLHDGAFYDLPLNALEARADADGAWRRFVGNALATNYADFFREFSSIVYLQAPSFEIVRRWRGQQEEEMLGRAMTTEECAALDRFIQHYERVTRSMLAGGLRVDWIARLDAERKVVAIEKQS